MENWQPVYSSIHVLIALFHQRKGEAEVFLSNFRETGRETKRRYVSTGYVFWLHDASPVHALLFQTPSSSLIVCFFSSCICTCCVYLSLPLPLSSQLFIHLSTSASLHVAHWPSLFPCNSFFSSSVSVSLSVLLPITISLLDIYEADSLCLYLDLIFKLFLKIKGSSHVPSLKRKV